MKTYGVGMAVVLAVITVLYFGSKAIDAAPITLSEGLTADWSNGAWLLTAALKDTGTQQGETIQFTANVTYTRDGQQISTEAQPVTLTVGISELKKEWITAEPVSLEIVPGSESGSGGCEVLPDGRLSWWVTATNDGSESQFSFKVKRK